MRFQSHVSPTINKLSVATDQTMSCEVRMIVEVFLHLSLQLGAKGFEVGLKSVCQLQHVFLGKQDETSLEGLSLKMSMLLQGKPDVS